MKYRLLAPGPTPVPDRVMREMSTGIIHHRTQKFQNIFRECREHLQWLFDSSYAPLILSCSGTGAFEASLQNFFCHNDKVLFITGGKFGEKWLEMGHIFGLNSVEIPVKWGQAVTVNAVKESLEKHPDAKGVVVVASETSTGVRHPYEEIGSLVKDKEDCLLIVDGVTAVGVWDIYPERDHVDVLITGSQKGLMLPPGLGFLWASEKAWRKQSKSDVAKYYFDLAREKKAQAKDQTAFTPAVTLIMGLHAALCMMRQEGREHIFARHKRMAQATRAAMTALGLKLFAEVPTDAITSVFTPQGLADDAVYQGLMTMANFTIAGGQDDLKGKIFRIGHMGYVDEIDLISVFGCLEIVLKKLGYEKFQSGASLAVASPILQDGFD